jgi:hypothetical protein
MIWGEDGGAGQQAFQPLAITQILVSNFFTRIVFDRHQARHLNVCNNMKYNASDMNQ